MRRLMREAAAMKSGVRSKDSSAVSKSQERLNGRKPEISTGRQCSNGPARRLA